jgi:phage terminase small subunit
MDPITTAIVAAIAAGVSKVGEQAVVDAYAKLKELLRKKFGARSKVLKAVKELEANPKSAARKDVVKEEVATAKADQDVELLKAAQLLLTAIKTKPDGERIIQTIIGDQNTQISGDGNVISVNTPKLRQ